MSWLAYWDTGLWTVLFVLFLIIEISTFNLITIWFSGSAFINIFLTLIKVADLNAPFGAQRRSWIPPVWQAILFLVLALLGIILFFPRLKKWQQKTKVETNVNALIGKVGVVTKTIKSHSPGQIKVEGQVWTAQGNKDESILEGTEVRVLSVEGVKAIVEIKSN